MAGRLQPGSGGGGFDCKRRPRAVRVRKGSIRHWNRLRTPRDIGDDRRDVNVITDMPKYTRTIGSAFAIPIPSPSRFARVHVRPRAWVCACVCARAWSVRVCTGDDPRAARVRASLLSGAQPIPATGDGNSDRSRDFVGSRDAYMKLYRFQPQTVSVPSKMAVRYPLFVHTHPTHAKVPS